MAVLGLFPVQGVYGGKAKLRDTLSVRMWSR